MDKLFIISAFLLSANMLWGQGHYIDTTVYSPALDREKMVRVWLPPCYDVRPELNYPVFYDYEKAGFWTKIAFVGWGAWAPNFNSPQKYINPPIVEFPLDENGLIIDTIVPKSRKNNISYLIQQLTPADSVGILYGCGSQDFAMFFPMNLNFKSTLENLGLPYEFYQHDGNHSMPAGFIQQAFIYLDAKMQHQKTNILPKHIIIKD